jgi:hypothetical protein
MASSVNKSKLIRSEATEVANHVKRPCIHEWLEKKKNLISPTCCTHDRTAVL